MSLSREQLLFAEIAKAMKKTVARQAIESDSDSEIQGTTNRGNKLKKRARFVRQGKLGPPTGPAVYKEEVEHAGHRRAIISRNPPLIDEDGYSIDSDDDEERVRDAVGAAAEADPYSSIRLEQLLAPLTSVTDLPTHPTLSRPFKSTALNELANQACDLMHKENRALWKVRPLLTRLTGDLTWVTPQMMLGPNDQDLFRNSYSPRTLKRKKSPEGDVTGTMTPNINGGSTAQPSVNGDTSLTINEESSSREKPATSGDDVTMTDSNGISQNKSTGEDREDPQTVNREHNIQRDRRSAEKEASLTAKDDTAEETGAAQTNGSLTDPISVKKKGKQPEAGQGQEDDDVVMVDGSLAAAAGSSAGIDQAGGNPHHYGSRAVSPSASIGESFIHPIFLAPKSTHPDRDLGLPEQEAEDIRRLLQMYVQKQEEVCRGTKKLYQGLLQADRLRKTVLEWSKAEGHIGEMSDGEDWYDKEEWRLTEDLKKGQDEEEEDTTPAQKKTRNRK
ncbi:Transcriptional regulatory protein rxt2 [Cytospora mali]|uniref:Transcriptional regulatory protein rxt2 n=1 Tax=Cytospora mali TaxID=578113 RepID=A0A194UMK5_CYTMA|nr:Transcriptional regulatory protein rxt2 [Valsa mali var. pyri (nom. inval.)]